MDWRRFKNIIIIVLVIINIFFCGFLIRLKILDGRVQRQTRDNVISVLKNNNISMDIEQFPNNMEECSVCYVTRFLPSDEEFINSVTDKNGKYSTQNEVMTFELVPNGKQELDKGNVISTCCSFMKKNKIAEDLYREGDFVVSSNEARIKFCLEYAGYTFFDSYLEFFLNGKGIYRVEGKNIIISEDNISSYDAKLLSVESIIVSVVENKTAKEKVEIDDISFGYYLGNSEEIYVSVLALPVWEIKFSDGDRLYYDARNGNLINL